MNCQLVMCRGVNDGGHLRKSLEKLGGLYPAVRSIAAVPTGLDTLPRRPVSAGAVRQGERL